MPLRFEFEINSFGLIKDNVKNAVDVETSVISFMLNFYYDFYNKSDLLPYINVGLGLNYIDFDFSNRTIGEDGDETEPSVQIGLGTYYKLNNNLFTDFGLKYNLSILDNFDYLGIASIFLGLRYNF